MPESVLLSNETENYETDTMNADDISDYSDQLQGIDLSVSSHPTV
jgi:hypothetical protein